MSCNNFFLGDLDHNQLDEAATSLLGHESGNARERLVQLQNLHFEFLERITGRSGHVYDLFFAEDGDRNIIVAFELEDGVIRRHHIRSYTKSRPSPEVFQKIPASCFLDQREYFEFIRTQLSVDTLSVEDILSFSEASGLFLHHENIDGENAEMIFLQKPFPVLAP